MILHSLVFYVSDGHNPHSRFIYGGPDNRLFDWGFEWFPNLDPLTLGFTPSNVCLYTLFAIASLFMGGALFFPFHASFVQMAWRTLFASFFTVTFREDHSSLMAYFFTVFNQNF